MKTILVLLLVLFYTNIYSQILVYKVDIEKPKSENTTIYLDSHEAQFQYKVLFNQEIDIKKAFSNQNLFFTYKNM